MINNLRGKLTFQGDFYPYVNDLQDGEVKLADTAYVIPTGQSF